MSLPPAQKEIFNKVKFGYFGQLGQGANAEITFLQTAITRDELDSITLIENIPGSEKWDVRDLFQRDVDNDRVTNEILPYLKDANRVKFFNPLTLALLPIDEDGERILREIPVVERSQEAEGEHEYHILELPEYFQFRVHTEVPAYSALKWNDQKVRIVAIDGQHRLSALKRWKNESGLASRPLADWRIPVVILGIFKANPELPAASILEIVRKTFVYINTKAEEVNEARAILLNDESVNCLCVQELVQAAHANDSVDFNSRSPTRVPLMFFDWRGEVRNHVRITGPASLKKIEEIRDWFENYLLGEDGSEDQDLALGIEDLVPPLETFGKDRTLSHQDSSRVRDQFRKTMMPGLLFLIENFSPYRTYIEECRRIERQALSESDLSEHAFMKLRFGTSRASEDQLEDVNGKYKQLVSRFASVKDQSLPELLRLDIGMRGVMFAFGEAKGVIDSMKEKTTDWPEYAKWFTAAINRIYDEGWFSSFSDQDSKKRRLLTHLAYDDVGTIVNYRFGDVPDALGLLLLLLVFSLADDVSKEDLLGVWTESSDGMTAPLRKGLRKQLKSKLQDSLKGTPAEFKAEINKRADKAVNKRLSDLRSYLDLD